MSPTLFHGIPPQFCLATKPPCRRAVSSTEGTSLWVCAKRTLRVREASLKEIRSPLRRETLLQGCLTATHCLVHLWFIISLVYLTQLQTAIVNYLCPSVSICGSLFKKSTFAGDLLEATGCFCSCF
jgi:hypothetical protein